MTTRLTPIATIALLLAGALLLPASAEAVTATASATIISPTEVLIVAAAELRFSASTGVLTLSIPGAGASGAGDGAAAGMTLSSTGVRGNTIVFSTTDSAPMASLVQALAAYGGTFGMNGILSVSNGQVVSLFVTHAEQGGNGKGAVYAVAAYN